MPARPCGVYVSMADLRNAVSGTPDISEEIVNKVLGLMEQHWHNQDAIDVITMAECFWLWQYQITDRNKDPVKSFQFEAIMSRIKDDRLVPTIATKSDIKH